MSEWLLDWADIIFLSILTLSLVSLIIVWITQ